MSFNNTPITAKIKRTSQGGVITQPILNMGAPVKMKASSPAKQTGTLVKYAAKQGVKHLPKLKTYTAEIVKGATKPGRNIVKNSKPIIDITQKVAPNVAGGGFMNAAKKIFKYGAMGAVGMGLSNFIGNKSVIVKPTPKPPEPTSGDSKPTKPYVKKDGEATGNMKDYKLNSQARKDEYTARGWKQDSTTRVAKPKVKAVSATPSVGVKEVSIKSKLDSKKETESKAPEQTRKTASIDKKQGKADKARANGNEKKAVRKEKAIKKKKARVAKRSEYQGQSKDAINPS